VFDLTDTEGRKLAAGTQAAIASLISAGNPSAIGP
jgi:hypothetical protein